MTLTPRKAGAVGLLALVPVAAYAAGVGGLYTGLITAVNVLLIMGILYTAFTPVEDGEHASHG